MVMMVSQYFLSKARIQFSLDLSLSGYARFVDGLVHLIIGLSVISRKVRYVREHDNEPPLKVVPTPKRDRGIHYQYFRPCLLMSIVAEEDMKFRLTEVERVEPFPWDQITANATKSNVKEYLFLKYEI